MMRPWTSVGAGGDEDELGAPGGLAVAFEVESAVGFGADGAESRRLCGRAAVSPGWARKRGVMTLPSAWSIRDQVGMGPRSGTVRVEQSEFAGLVGGEFAVQRGERGEDVGVGEVAVAGVEVVVASHRRRRAASVTGPWGSGGGCVSRMKSQTSGWDEFGFDLAGAAVHADQRFVDEPHVLGILAASSSTSRVRGRDQLRESIDRRVLEDRLDAVQFRDPVGCDYPSGLLFWSGPVPAEHPGGSVETAHPQRPCRHIDPAGRAQDLTSRPRRQRRRTHVWFACKARTVQGLANRLRRMRPATLRIVGTSICQRHVVARRRRDRGGVVRAVWTPSSSAHPNGARRCLTRESTRAGARDRHRPRRVVESPPCGPSLHPTPTALTSECSSDPRARPAGSAAPPDPSMDALLRSSATATPRRPSDRPLRSRAHGQFGTPNGLRSDAAASWPHSGVPRPSWSTARTPLPANQRPPSGWRRRTLATGSARTGPRDSELSARFRAPETARAMPRSVQADCSVRPATEST